MKAEKTRLSKAFPAACAAACALIVFWGVGRGAAVGAADASAMRILPRDLVYAGAFRLPDGPYDYAWAWSGQGLAYYPDGDPTGPDDGHPGSLFGIGHDAHQYVSEIGIPKPVISLGKKVEELNTAVTLQDFKDICGGLYGELEQARSGLAYLPKQGGQDTGKLYFCRAPHLGEEQKDPRHGWCDLDLVKPQPAGLWKIADETNYVTCDYMFPVDPVWAEKNAPGMLLATGRFRDGGQGAQGPALFLIAPWKEGCPPKPGATLPAVTLLKYSSVMDEEQNVLGNYHHSDEWSGGAWLFAGGKSAVVFVGTKGKGKCWYGFANGVVWPDEEPFPEVPPAPNDQRGWWSTEFEGQMIFYDPAELAGTASGKIRPDRPQPYAVLGIDNVMFALESKQRQRHFGAAAFDRARGFLYVLEFRGDGDKSLVHVWRIGP